MPFTREELTFGAIADINSKSLCRALANGALEAKKLYEIVPASEVFEMHAMAAIEQYNERIMNKRIKR